MKDPRGDSYDLRGFKATCIECRKPFYIPWETIMHALSSSPHHLYHGHWTNHRSWCSGFRRKEATSADAVASPSEPSTPVPSRKGF